MKSHGYTQASLQTRYGIIGTPLVDVGASFHAPARFDEELVVSATIGEWKRSTFRVIYRGMVADRCIVSGHEIRAFVAKHEGGTLSSVMIPDEFRALFSQGAF